LPPRKYTKWVDIHGTYSGVVAMCVRHCHSWTPIRCAIQTNKPTVKNTITCTCIMVAFKKDKSANVNVLKKQKTKNKKTKKKKQTGMQNVA